MNNSDQLNELITRHFCNELNRDEEAALLQWISASDENRQYYEALKNTWQLMIQPQKPDEIHAGEEWAYFQDCLQQDLRGERDYTSEKAGSGSVVRRLIMAGAIAASVLFVVAVGYYRLGKKDSVIPDTATVEKNSAATVLVRREVNATDIIKQLVLADSSEIMLNPASEVTFNEPFPNNRRDIVLKGSARFHVAKDAARPFTVFSGPIATTALGTQFTVYAFEKDDRITVQLFEGKVMVRLKGQNDYNLLPGEELVYRKSGNTVSIHRFNPEITAPIKKMIEHIEKDQPSLPVGDKTSWYMFNNQPLAQVFKQLEEMYGVDIVFSEKDIAKMYFIGKFSKGDSVSKVLKQIAVLNDLTVTKQNNTYTISKP